MKHLIDELKRLADQRGLTVELVSDASGHWRVQGFEDVIVNYWPGSKNKTAHVDGVNAGVRNCYPMDVIRLATTRPPARSLQPKHREKRIERIREKMDKEAVQAMSSESTSVPPWED